MNNIYVQAVNESSEHQNSRLSCYFALLRSSHGKLNPARTAAGAAAAPAAVSRRQQKTSGYINMYVFDINTNVERHESVT